MHAEDPRDLDECRDAGIAHAGLDLLIGGARDTGREEHLLLGEVEPQTADTDAVADGAALPEEPVVIIGQVHSASVLPKMIIRQPGKPGIM